MREKADDGSALLELCLQLRNKRQRLRIGIVQVKDDQGRLFFAVLLHFVEQIFFSFYKLDFDVELARGLLNFGDKEKVVDKGEDARNSVFRLGRQRFRVDWIVGGSEARPLAADTRTIVSAKSSAVAMVHRGGVDAAVLLTITTVLSAAMRRTPATPASVSASSATAGGASRSCIHSLSRVRKIVLSPFGG